MTVEISNYFNKQFVRSKHTPLIQIIDDDSTGIIHLKLILEEQGWMVLTDTDPQTALLHYFELRPDCVILEENLPKKHGYHIIKDLQKHNNKIFMPTIIIGTDSSREARIHAYQNGADDYFSKPIDHEEIIVRIRRHLELKNIFEQAVLIDEMTQVYNRKFLQIDLAKGIDDCNRTEQSLSVVVLDLDDFTSINTNYGHLIGDAVLADFAGFLKNNVRCSDTVYRINGDRFALQLPRTNSDKSLEVLNRLLQQYKGQQHHYDGKEFSITFSAGVVEIHSNELNPESVVGLAEQALETAKREGKAKVVKLDDLTSLNKKRLNISIINHDPIIRTMLMKMFNAISLEKVDVNIEVFDNGDQFFDTNRMNEKGKHFIIFEAVMPVMSGIEILNKIKKTKPRTSHRIFMLAGKKDEREIARALKLGADDYMTKPYSVTELTARIERLLQGMM